MQYNFLSLFYFNLYYFQCFFYDRNLIEFPQFIFRNFTFGSIIDIEDNTVTHFVIMNLYCCDNV